MNIINKTNNILITGPCSVESEEQIYKTAQQLIELNLVDIFRAGVWKPRTKPGLFEGVGVQGLPWLQNIQKTFNIPVSTEVANAKQVELCLKHDINYLWLGARTVTNPFSVQEVVDALKGSNIVLGIKNPACPDISLWKGAIERCMNAQLDNIFLIHRGFKTSYTTCLRNEPLWDTILEMKKEYKDLKIILDPSHIAGDKSYIQPLIQQSKNIPYDGYMIESHYEPNLAITDASQQVTPKTLYEILNSCNTEFETHSNNDLFPLVHLRKAIDELDLTVLNLLVQRLELSQSIGKWKRENNLAIYQPNRWDNVKQRLHDDAKKLGISNNFMDAFLSLLHQESVRLQTNIITQYN